MKPALRMFALLFGFAVGCAPKDTGNQAPKPNSETLAEGATVFTNMDCNIAAINSAVSDAGKSINWWTDGTSTRFNYPVDIYIDTGMRYDWSTEEAEVRIIVQSDTITSAAQRYEYRVRRGALHARNGSRGLIRLTNAFDIDPKVHRLHLLGSHTITITVIVDGTSYTGTAAFVIF
jgi:hypothetical protein